ncbi:MAG: hypothetical protein U0R50_08235 [Gaiellales bacterium]
MKRLLAAMIVGALCASVVAGAGSTRSSAAVAVTITPASCTVSPRTAEAGAFVFRVINRSGSPATFAVGARRARVPAGRTAKLAITLRAGSVAYVCLVRARRVGSGRLTVTSRRPPLAVHRIGVRQIGSAGEFYDRTTGAKFVPRGHEYVRMGVQQDIDGKPFTYFTLFNVGSYDANRSDAALTRMAERGYNVVTVGVNALCIDACAADPKGRRLRAAYFANLADFLRRAKSHGVYVMLGTQFILGNTAYADLINEEPRDQVDGVNLIPLTEGGIRAYEQFWTDVVRELRRQGAPLDAVFAYETWDEISFVSYAKPFNVSSGSFRAPNGRTYDLANAGDRRRLMDDGLVYWVDRVRAAIRKVDPTALVTVGLFEPQEPNPSRFDDLRILSTQGLITRSSADFIDIHPYPGSTLTLQKYMENFGAATPVPKPIVIGEYGANRAVYHSPGAAVPALVDWQRQSCHFGIDGWILWTWDTEELPEFWTAVSGNGEIEQALAPKNRPNPCA